MKNQITIDVQWQDIFDFHDAIARHRSTKKFYSANCPISNAIGREFATTDVVVENNWSQTSYNLVLHGMTFKLPKVACNFIRALDDFKLAKPFKFVLRASHLGS